MDNVNLQPRYEIFELCAKDTWTRSILQIGVYIIYDCFRLASF